MCAAAGDSKKQTKEETWNKEDLALIKITGIFCKIALKY